MRRLRLIWGEPAGWKGLCCGGEARMLGSRKLKEHKEKVVTLPGV